MDHSAWVMWVGNVPSDCSQPELQAFLDSNPPSSTLSSAAASVPSGVLSIFLMLQSHCAFVNYDSPANLDRGVELFNGRHMRPADLLSLPLVCKLRKAKDAKRSGVGSQRGVGMHLKWITYQQTEGIKAPSSPEGIDVLEVPSYTVIRRPSSLPSFSYDSGHSSPGMGKSQIQVVASRSMPEVAFRAREFVLPAWFAESL